MIPLIVSGVGKGVENFVHFALRRSVSEIWAGSVLGVNFPRRETDLVFFIWNWIFFLWLRYYTAVKSADTLFCLKTNFLLKHKRTLTSSKLFQKKKLESGMALWLSCSKRKTDCINLTKTFCEILLKLAKSTPNLTLLFTTLNLVETWLNDSLDSEWGW